MIAAASLRHQFALVVRRNRQTDRQLDRQKVSQIGLSQLAIVQLSAPHDDSRSSKVALIGAVVVKEDDKVEGKDCEHEDEDEDENER